MGGITVFSLNNSRITIVVIVVSVLLGIGTFLTMPRFEDPNIVIREAVVFAAFPGMEPRQVEDLITRRLEEKIRTIGEVDEIRSDSKNGVSIIHVELGDDVQCLMLVFDGDKTFGVWADARVTSDDQPEE